MMKETEPKSNDEGSQAAAARTFTTESNHHKSRIANRQHASSLAVDVIISPRFCKSPASSITDERVQQHLRKMQFECLNRYQPRGLPLEFGDGMAPFVADSTRFGISASRGGLSLSTSRAFQPLPLANEASLKRQKLGESLQEEALIRSAKRAKMGEALAELQAREAKLAIMRQTVASAWASFLSPSPSPFGNQATSEINNSSGNAGLFSSRAFQESADRGDQILMGYRLGLQAGAISNRQHHMVSKDSYGDGRRNMLEVRHPHQMNRQRNEETHRP